MKLKISVVIPTLNSGQTFERCLASIAGNRTKYEWELIVVDAGSDDGTLDMAQRYTEKIFIKEGCPPGEARNIGVEKAQGEVICFTDSDCVVPENWIDGLVDSLLRLNQEEKSIVGVGGGSNPLLEAPPFMELAISRSVRSPLVSFGARNVTAYRKEMQVLHNPPLNSAYLKWALEEVGGFGERFGYPEDLELDARLNEAGYKLYYLPHSWVYHKHKTDLKSFIRQMFDFGGKRVRLARNHKGYLQQYDLKRQRETMGRILGWFSRLYHYGPALLLLMTFSPLFFIPLGMALTNAFLISLKWKSPALFFPSALLTLAFYVSYGAGEIRALLER